MSPMDVLELIAGANAVVVEGVPPHTIVGVLAPVVRECSDADRGEPS